MAENVRSVGPRHAARGMKSTVKNPMKVFGRLMGYVMKYYKFRYIAVMLLIVVSVLASVQGTMFIKTLIDSYITPMLESGSTDFSMLLQAIIKVAGFYLIGIAATYVYNRLMVYITQGTMLRLREEVFTHMETLPIKYFDTRSRGDIMSVYTNDIDTLRQMISQALPQFFSSAMTIISTFAGMLILSWRMTLVALAMVAVMLLVSKAFAGKSGKYFVAQQKSLGDVNGYIEEMMNGQKVIKVFNHEDVAVKEFNEKNDELLGNAARANIYANILMPINAQLGNLSFVVCAVVGGLMALAGMGGLTLGGLASFLTFDKSINMPINQISMQLNSVVMALAGADRVFNLLDEKPETDEGRITLVNVEEKEGVLTETEKKTNKWAWKDPDKVNALTPLKGEIIVDHVDFGYNDKKTILHDIEMYAYPGQKIAFVGSTGAGKTTITNLLNRFYEIQSGTITYDGIDIKKIKKDDLRHALGFVLQETDLFSETVKENIRYGRLDASDEEVTAAAKLSGADTFINYLPEGYDTWLKGDGTNLSQGQRQLLSIARAAACDPPVLVLDEATSSIDTRTEKIVQNGMDELMKGRTTFVIAHRLSTVKNADCIMVLEQGRIIERGSHEDLIAKKGRYYQLYTGMSA